MSKTRGVKKKKMIGCESISYCFRPYSAVQWFEVSSWQLTNVIRTSLVVDGSIIVFTLPACGLGWRKASATTRVRIDGTEKGNSYNEIVVSYL